MDTVQKQITILSHKVDALYQVIDRLSDKVTESLSEIRLHSSQNDNSASATNAKPFSYQSPSLMGSVMEHKDVLVDNNNDLSNHQSSEKTLSPDVQVQRLTAQLTAAYNRIAALEEQLLSRRIHS
ncbi:MAG: hypothetical protein WBG73_09845 [Coleofasciculaceae cyanobacterium]